MRLDAIRVGNNPPDDINVIVEVPVGGEPIKYEIEKESGALFVDRFLYTPMRYPGQLRLRSAHPVRRRRSARRPHREHARAGAGVGHQLPPGRRVGHGGRIGDGRKADRGAEQQADPALRRSDDGGRPAADHAQPDRAFLPALQGPRARQVGENRQVGRCDDRARDRTRGDRTGRTLAPLVALRR